jgi:hypothetical protein
MAWRVAAGWLNRLLKSASAMAAGGWLAICQRLYQWRIAAAIGVMSVIVCALYSVTVCGILDGIHTYVIGDDFGIVCLMTLKYSL